MLGLSLRRRLVLAALAVLSLVGTGSPLRDGGAAQAFTGDERVVLSSGRSFVLHVPPQLREQDAGAGRPAMMVLHGLRSNPADLAEVSGFDARSDRTGVLVAYPVGLRHSFDAGWCCGEASAQQVDDVDYLADVVADLRRRGAGRVAVVGFSNGAMMAYRFGCERPELVDTVGVLSGTLLVPRCRGPIRALHLHGRADTVVPLAGSPWSPSLRSYLLPVVDIQAAAPGSSITVRTYAGLPHRWTEPGDAVDATAQFWAFARMDAPH